MRRPLLLLLAGLTAVALAGTRKPPKAEQAADVDPIALASMLLREGHDDRARQVLEEVDPVAADLELSQYYWLRGLARFQQRDWRPAAEDFQRSIDAGEIDVVVRTHLAQAWLSAGEPTRSVAALDAGGAEVEAAPGAWMTRARANWELGRYDAAWSTLATAEGRFPDRSEFGVQRVMLMIELDLYQEARRQGVALLSRFDAPLKLWAAIGDALRRAGHPGEAVQLLEQARLRFPGELDVLVPLARAWLDDGKPLAAAVILQEAAVLDNTFASESAEMYRRAHSLHRALAMNALVDDQKEKTRQRLGLLIEGGEFEQAVALTPRLRRHGLTHQDPVAYALAFACFRIGDVATAELWLGGITDAGLFRDATQLREAMAECDSTWGGCL